MKPIYLKVDRKSNDFQLVHLDALHGYGIAFKFIFFENKNAFLITDAKLIKASSNGPIEYEVKIDKEFREVNEANFKFQIDISSSLNIYKPGHLPATDLERGNGYIAAIMDADGIIKTECLIDLHINNKESLVKSLNKKLAVDWGTEFCKFYIV